MTTPTTTTAATDRTTPVDLHLPALGPVADADPIVDPNADPDAEPSGGAGAETRPLLPFYVYELRDPRSGRVFYVGKGTGLRLDHHTAGSDDEKRQRIDEIERAGFTVSRIVIGRFETEAEAYAVESVLIKWVYGFMNLTNKVHGHGGDAVRGWGASDDPIPGLDVERPPPGVRDGSYTADLRERIERNDVVGKLEALRAALANAAQFQGRGLTFHDVDVSRPDNPGFRVTGFSDHVHLKVDMQKGGDRVKLGLGPIGRAHYEGFTHALTAIAQPYRIKNPDSPGRYTHTADFVRRGPWRHGIPYGTTDDIIAHIEQTLVRLADVARPGAGTAASVASDTSA